jgi:hypothetical protein
MAGDDPGEEFAPAKAAPFQPTTEWILALEAQATIAMMERVQWYAAKQAQAAGASYAAELVRDAITQTLSGSAGWDPARSPLEVHLIDFIRWRTWNDRIVARAARPSANHNTDLDETAEMRPVPPRVSTQEISSIDREDPSLRPSPTLMPTDDDAQLHDRATKAMASSISTERGQHSARNMIQWVQLHIEQMRQRHKK